MEAPVVIQAEEEQPIPTMQEIIQKENIPVTQESSTTKQIELEDLLDEKTANNEVAKDAPPVKYEV